MTDIINIRKARITDNDFIQSLVCRLTEFGPPPHRDQNAMISADTKILSGILSDPNSEHEIFIAENKSNVPLGFIHLQPGSDYYYKEKHGHISDIIVCAEAEGKGIGRSLMMKAEEWARQKGFRWLTLSVFAQNARAREVYSKSGYVEDIMKYVKEIN